MNNAQLSETLAVPTLQATAKRDHVKQVFEDVAHYLSNRSVDIQFRKDTVRAFAGSIEWRRLLDIGCGDGSISLQLLHPGTQLTLVDLSAAMISRAKANVPESLAQNVRLYNGDFLTTNLEQDSYDLIVTVGVMAHVESVDLFLSRIKSLLRPGGSLIVEFTDCEHLVGRLGRFWSALKECVAPAKYRTNKLSSSRLHPIFENHGLHLVSTFRYARLPLPGVDQLLSMQSHYRICRSIFGTSSSQNTNSGWGNEYICLLTAD